MLRKLFGTDGIRGSANKEPMTAETMMRVGAAAGKYFTRGNHQHEVVVECIPLNQFQFFHKIQHFDFGQFLKLFALVHHFLMFENAFQKYLHLSF